MLSRRKFLQAASIYTLAPGTSYAADHVNLVNIGDHGSGGSINTLAVANFIRTTLKPDLIFTNGDNAGGLLGGYSYADNNSMYQSYIDSGRFLPTLGNHDLDIDDGTLYRNYFSVPRYYARIVGNVLLVSVDSTNLDSKQQNWAKETLEMSNERWKFVFTHYSPYSSGGHGSHPHTQLPWHDWGADAVFAGHNHVYERLEYESNLYFVNGLGGRSLYEFGSPLPFSVARFNQDYGCMHITGDNSRISFEFINLSGQVVDTRILEKTISMAPIYQSLDLI